MSAIQMDTYSNRALLRQFGATIDMLENAIRACPDELWRGHLWTNDSDPPGFSEFWYLAYHSLFWLDFYLTGTEEGFAPPAPFTLDEFDPAGVLPERPYTKDELQAYLRYSRKKCQATIEALTAERAGQQHAFPWGEISFGELLLYNMRHVQEHAAQLCLFLGQNIDSPPGWVSGLKRKPDEG